ncbi:hypothetical protein AB0C52_24430 [Streptomyces sp. NPDC048717]|uniref:hypothetical protein n=1 Tax=Streptomyces sp. NPDC048717 TaxID=3154928 RepID=UPI0034207F4C
MSFPDALARTADRRRSTGESHQALHPLLPEDGSALAIPPARHAEQARLEAELFLRLRPIGGLCAHPLGIIRLRPKPDRLTIRVINTPYIVMCWAELLLPRLTGEQDADPRDLVVGVPGLRYRGHPRGIHLYRPATPARITLTGFSTRWWDRIISRMRRQYDGLVPPRPGWTPGERAAYDTSTNSPIIPTPVLSPLLRRIRATAGTGTVNSTSAWTTCGGIRMEATDGPLCADLVRLLGDGPTGTGWQVTHQRCVCSCGDHHDGCSIDFSDPATGTGIYYSNPCRPSDLDGDGAERRLIRSPPEPPRQAPWGDGKPAAPGHFTGGVGTVVHPSPLPARRGTGAEHFDGPGGPCRVASRTYRVGVRPGQCPGQVADQPRQGAPVWDRRRSLLR